jgi:RNA polymerase sigma factor (sigma-70 family)
LSIQSIHNEAALLRRLQQGSEEAFTELYRHYSPQLYLKIFWLVKDQQLSEELVQDLFTRLWLSKTDIDPEQNFPGYLATIATRMIIDTFRKIRRDDALKQKILNAAKDTYGHIEENADYRESKKHLDNALASLSPQQATAYRLCRLEGYSYREAAGMMGISVNTIKEYIAIANKNIRAYMMNHLDSALVLIMLFWSNRS